MNEKVAVIVLAGGKGTRFKAQKQFLEFHGRPLWKHVYDKARSLVPEKNIVVVGVDVPGGETRSLSMVNGLSFLKEQERAFEKLLILEAARPLVTKEQIEDILKVEAKSATYVFPLVNSIIKKDGTFLNREDYFETTTPVCLDFKMICDAYLSGHFYDLTEDTRVLYESYGVKPVFLMGGENLFKLTYQRDLPVLEAIYNKTKEAD